MSLYKAAPSWKLKNNRVSSGASRNWTTLSFIFLLNKNIKSLSTKYVWSSGINNKGRITVRSKGKKILKPNTLRINNNFLDNSLNFLYSIGYCKNKNFPYALFFSSSGRHSYIKINNSSSKLFNIFINKGYFDKFTKKNLLLKANLSFPHFQILYSTIFRLAFLSLIQNLQIGPGKKSTFSKSLGSYSTLLRKNLTMLSAVVKLPSGVRKVFSIFSLCNELDKRQPVFKTSWTKKNYIKGLAPRSRGIAKNPVDHPHGGRTKSIKYPRTPWGKTTKFK